MCKTINVNRHQYGTGSGTPMATAFTVPLHVRRRQHRSEGQGDDRPIPLLVPYCAACINSTTAYLYLWYRCRYASKWTRQSTETQTRVCGIMQSAIRSLIPTRTCTYARMYMCMYKITLHIGDPKHMRVAATPALSSVQRSGHHMDSNDVRFFKSMTPCAHIQTVRSRTLLSP